MNLELNKVYLGNSLDVVRTLPDESVNCVITSPPYYRLRDYGVDGQIGLEESPQRYIEKMVGLFREIRRVLKQDGTIWVNLGDSYCVDADGEIKHKDLIGIPWMFAFAMRADGWYLRQDIIWSKPNPMPESVTDRCTKSHEYIFLFSKSPRYYFDAESISEPVADSTNVRMNQDVESQKGSTIIGGGYKKPMKACAPRFGGKKYTETPDVFYRTKSGDAYKFREKRNRRSVWSVSTRPFKEAHFATYPEMLIRPCVLAGCPEGGVILDPFMGSGTTGIVARKLNRNFVGIELNPEYQQMATRRICEHGENLFNQL